MIRYQSWFSIQRPINQIDVMNANEFNAYAEIWSANSGQSIPDGILRGGNTDWQDEIMRRAFSQSHNLSFSGGSEENRYYVSLGYLDQEGVILESNFQRYSFRTNLNYSPINDFIENPVLYAKEVLDKTTVNRWLTSTTIKAEIIRGLSNNTRLGIDFTNNRKDQYFPHTFNIILGGEGGYHSNQRESELCAGKLLGI